MSRINWLLSFILVTIFSSCEAIGDIFKAGMYWGIFLVVIVIVIIIWIIAKVTGGGGKS